MAKSKDLVLNRIGGEMQDTEKAIDKARAGVQSAIDQIPPDAWPMIDLAIRITIVVAVVWLLLSLFAWWRRRAYNLTVASTARRNKKAQPDFLNVDEKARKEAVKRGDAHEDALVDRETAEELAAMKAAKGPITFAKRFASLASLIMSVFTLGTAISGVILNVGRMGDYLKEGTTGGRLQYLFQEHTIGMIIVLLIVGIHIYFYITKKKWEA